MIMKRTHQLAWIAVPAGGVNILLNFILIPRIGIMGAAIATFAGYAVLAIFAYMLGRRSFEIKIDWGHMGKLMFVSGVIVLITLIAESMNVTPLIEIAIKTIGLLSFPVLLIWTRFVGPAQTREIMDLVRGLVSNKLAGKRGT
jgi:O-antigen/teichoic acid export membrane protein